MSRVLDRIPSFFTPKPPLDRDGGEGEKPDLKQSGDTEGHSAQLPHLPQNPDADDSSSSIDIEQSEGVTKIEALYLVFGNGWKLWTLWGSIALICIAYSLSQMTTYAYAAFATSAFGEHTILGTISVITSIMSGVAKPFIAKCADLFSGPWALAISVLFYTIGYIVVASSQNVGAVAGGEVIYTLGNTGINFVSSILLGDITSLQWRGFVNGLYSLPFIPFAFVAGDIAASINAYSVNGWRWGYGMFCIIVPVTIAPSIAVLFWGDYRAKKVGALSLASSSYARKRLLSGTTQARKTPTQLLIHYARQMDAFDLLLLTFAFGCILSPFTLNTNAKGGYTNRDDTSIRTSVQRYTHRYKYLHLCGLSIRIIAQGLVYLSASKSSAGTTATIVMGQILISLGGGISVISSSVACQGSVPHQDMALAMALLSLWTSIGGSIASAIAAAVWNKQVPAKLALYLGDTHNSTELAEIFGSILVARTAQPRPLVIQAYNEAIRPLYIAALVTSTLSLVAGAFTTNFYLGTTHNAIEKKEVVFRSADETAPEVVAAKAREVEEKIAARLAEGEPRY
ncbi:siderophore-iron transporter Str1 [Kwoniella mangroviensis CBS 10435]|uniref:Siderophore-iron transporter Str1 n=1 Tax=Kwoniella mangroviensis CBS 10435 TaxID=1331196 RepID=A0A1B9IUA9_9TREE|nr:siderophore-iron transporter Str1 [Kwoniella mangroviensis CBS 10435]